MKYHRCRRNGHGPVPLNNEQRFKFTMSTYNRAAHHCDQRWTCVLTAFNKDGHSESNVQQFRLRKLSPRLTRFHGIRYQSNYKFLENLFEYAAWINMPHKRILFSCRAGLMSQCLNILFLYVRNWTITKYMPVWVWYNSEIFGFYTLHWKNNVRSPTVPLNQPSLVINTPESKTLLKHI